MPHRRFKDANNIEWHVQDIVESGEPPRASRPQLALDSTHFPRFRAWLSFESAHEQRRLSPIPESWATLPVEGLVKLLEQATPVSPPA
jgi:hypothetical protein